MYLLIVGAGKLGRNVAELALNNGDDVVAIDKDKEKCESLTKKYDLVAICGDAAQKEVLEEAEIDRADAIVTTVDDATNLMVISLAKEMGVKSLVSVVHQSESKPMFLEKGATIVGNPEELVAKYLYRAIQRPQIGDFIHLNGDSEIFKISLENPELNGKSINELREDKILPKESSIIAVERGSKLIIPQKETELQMGDYITILSREKVMDKTIDMFGSKKE